MAELTTALRTREQPQWAFGYGAAWGNSGWGLYEYSGWGITGATFTELDETQSRTQETDTTDTALSQLQVCNVLRR